jgi:hypothetical protein
MNTNAQKIPNVLHTIIKIEDNVSKTAIFLFLSCRCVTSLFPFQRTRPTTTQTLTTKRKTMLPSSLPSYLITSPYFSLNKRNALKEKRGTEQKKKEKI